MLNREELNKNIYNKAKGLPLNKESLKALDKFQTMGLPHKKLENYKYTNVDAFFPKEIEIASTKPNFNNSQVTDTIWMVFQDGYLNPNSVNLPEGVKLEIKKISSKSESNFDSLENLNVALAEEVVVLTVLPNVSVASPVHVSHESTLESQKTIVSSQLEINVAQNSVLKIIEQFNSSDDGLYNRNHMTTIRAGENSNIEHVKAVTEGNSSFHFGSVNAIVEKNACLHSFTFTTGAKLSRNNINVELVGIGARGEVHGLYALRGEQHCDNFSTIHHRIERTESEQLFKAVLDDLSHGIFTGKIVVHRDAQLVNSSQLNKNLLLSKKSHADTRPQLEVYADDVKCAHGATVGQLSEEELFYLESRAISPKDARIMLCHGFVQEALDKIQNDEIRNYLEKLLYNEYEKNIHNRIREDEL